MRIKKAGFVAFATLAAATAGLFLATNTATADEAKTGVLATCQGTSSCTKTYTVAKGADLHLYLDAIGGSNKTIDWYVTDDVDGGQSFCTGTTTVDAGPTRPTCGNYPSSIAHVVMWDKSMSTHNFDVNAWN